jgi:hypothetical protein
MFIYWQYNYLHSTQSDIKFNAIPNKIILTFLTETHKIILKFIWKQISRIAKEILSKKSNTVGTAEP